MRPAAPVAALALALLGTGDGFALPPKGPALTARAREKVSPWLAGRIDQGLPPREVLVVLNQEADLSGAAALATKTEKAAFVRDALLAVAETSQRSLRARLSARGLRYRSYFIVNMLWVEVGEGTTDVVNELAERPDVLRVEANPTVRNEPRVEVGGSDAAPHTPGEVRLPLYTAAVATVGANIAYTRAPEVWALGATGQGVVVGAQDTGYQWTHPALRQQYRGWNGTAATHDYSWHDSIHTSGSTCGKDSPEPCDDDAHGTHTLGTAVGDDHAGNQIGMAPGARWIGCRDMDRGNGTPATYTECLEFFLAPYPVGGTPRDGDPSKAPDVTNNSWGCPPSEGCSALTLQSALDAQRAAGILTVASAGNSGPGCSSVNDPPALYDSAYSVAALQTGSDVIASFSSRGPVTVDGSSRPKPDIAAPGTTIRSSVPGGTFAQNGWSGTSMAGPHVAGAVALLWSAQPVLKNQIEQTIQILNDTAVAIPATSCGSSGVPNSTYGFGRLDVKAAVDAALVRPILSAISPSSGATSGGTSVVLTGANFAPGATVTFGGTPATEVVVESPTRLRATVPAHPAGAVDVVVSVAGKAAGRKLAAFTYASCAPPALVASSNGPLCEGQTLFLNATAVPGATYRWTGPLGFTSALRDPVLPRIALGASGVYAVTATAGGCVSAPATTAVVVTPFPVSDDPAIIFGCTPGPEPALVSPSGEDLR